MEVLDAIVKYWVIILGLIAFITAFVNIKSQNNEQQKEIDCLKAEVKSVNTSQLQIDVRLAEIQKDIQWIKESLTYKH